MKKLVIISFLCFLIPALGLSQETISGQSQSKYFNLKPGFKRGLPPNLYVNLNFKDANNNGIIEAQENGELKLRITNRGKGPAQALKVEIQSDQFDPAFKIGDKQEIPMLYPGRTEELIIPIEAGKDIQTKKHKIMINVREHFGYDMDPAYLVLNTYEYQEPKMVFSGVEIVDYGEGTAPISADNQLQPGEMVKAKIYIQNVGNNVAKNTTYSVSGDDPNIFLEEAEGQIGDIGIGEVKSFWVKISPNKRVHTKGELPIFLTVNEQKNEGELVDYQLPIKLNAKPPEQSVLNVEANLESFRKNIARFEYKSNKFSANIESVINIREVTPSKTQRPNSAALIIGIEHYRHIPPAPYAENDAEVVEKYFKQKLGMENVVTLTSKEAYGFFFDDYFNPDIGELQKAIIKGKTDLFVFYSGHGMPSKDGKNVYLFPSDGRIERLEEQGYNLDLFYKNLEKLEAKSVTVFLDACFSGASKASEKIKTENLVSMKGLRIEPKVRKPWEKNPNFNVFMSSSGDQTSLGFDQSKTGLFTYYLAAGMKGEADSNNDGKLTLGELKEYVIKNVEETSTKITGLQTPEFHGNEDMILFEF